MLEARHVYPFARKHPTVAGSSFLHAATTSKNHANPISTGCSTHDLYGTGGLPSVPALNAWPERRRDGLFAGAQNVVDERRVLLLGDDRR